MNTPVLDYVITTAHSYFSFEKAAGWGAYGEDSEVDRAE